MLQNGRTTVSCAPARGTPQRLPLSFNLAVLTVTLTTTSACLVPPIDAALVKGPEIEGPARIKLEYDGPERCRTIKTTPLAQEQTVTRQLATPWLSQSMNFILAGAGIGTGTFFFIEAASESNPMKSGLDNANVQLGLIATAIGATGLGLFIANVVRARDGTPELVDLPPRIEHSDWKTGDICGPEAIKIARERRQEAQEAAERAAAAQAAARERELAEEAQRKALDEQKDRDRQAAQTRNAKLLAAASKRLTFARADRRTSRTVCTNHVNVEVPCDSAAAFNRFTHIDGSFEFAVSNTGRTRASCSWELCGILSICAGGGETTIPHKGRATVTGCKADACELVCQVTIDASESGEDKALDVVMKTRQGSWTFLRAE